MLPLQFQVQQTSPQASTPDELQRAPEDSQPAPSADPRRALAEVSSVDCTGKVRRPWVVALLTIVTAHFYFLVWYYRVNGEMRDFASTHGDENLAESNPWTSLLAVTSGSILVVPAIVSMVRTVGRVQATERLASVSARPRFLIVAMFISYCGFSCAAVTGVIVFSIPSLVALVVAMVLVQSRLNAAWRNGKTMAVSVGRRDCRARPVNGRVGRRRRDGNEFVWTTAAGRSVWL
jgi:hypothetical protein